MGDVVVGETSCRAVFDQASELYVRVFGYPPTQPGLNPLLLKALVANGGTAVSAMEQERLVGFAYGFVGREGRETYAYSQATFVDPAFQGTGLGRRLKEAQRSQALRLGFNTMRWAFDPLMARNAHFNLEVLGARGLRTVRCYYGSAGSDRLIVEWDLHRDRMPVRLEAPAQLPPSWGVPAESDDGRIWIRVPADPRSIKQTHRRTVSSRLAEALQSFEGAGSVVVACRRVDAASFAYVLEGKSK